MNGGALAALTDSSPSLAALRPHLERAAVAEAPLLVLGEPGTGRSALARALHAASRRRDGPLVEVDPGALAPALIESELFGHRPGAFTGAERVYAGRVERAHGGTLILDHVEELPLGAQPKLLRLLSEHLYTPLGGIESQSDARFVAIGAHDLAARVAQGLFRADLYWRLEVLTFELPPLRRRPGDVLPIAEAMLRDLAARFDRPAVRLSARARAWMPQADWPGNLRQLRNLLERALLAADADELDPPPPTGASAPRPSTLAEAERAAIVAALAHTRGHQGAAAELLGISRKGLWEKRRRHGIP